MQTTANLGLKKPEGTDVVNIQDFNDNADLLDTAVAAKETLAGAQAKANTAEANAKAYADGKVAGLVNSSPTTLDTLKELANALGSDPNYAATTATLIGTKAPLASPALTGTPTAPTVAVDTSTTQVATTAFVLGQVGMTTPLMSGTAGVGTSKRYARADHVHPADTSRAAQMDFAAHLVENATETVKGHVELATATETTTGTDNTKAVTPLGLKSATNLLITSTQKGVASGIATLNTLGQVVQLASVFLPEYNASSINLSNIPANQIWKLNNYLTNEFQMKMGSTKYYVNLKSLLTAYPTSGFNVYTGDLYYNNTFPNDKTITVGTPSNGETNTVTLNSDRITMAVYVPSSGDSATTRVSFGNYDISAVKRIDVTFRVVSTTNMSSDEFRVSCTPAFSTNTMGTVGSGYYGLAGVGSSYATISYDVTNFLGIAEVAISLSEAYSSASSAHSMTVDVSRVTLVSM